jgi:hypothetical protein
MSTRLSSLPAIVLARLARGAVPVDGYYAWDRQKEASAREPVRHRSPTRVRHDVCATHV